MCHQYETGDDLQMTLTAGELLNTSTDWPRVCSRSSATTLFFQSSIRSCRGVTSMSVIALDNTQQKRVNTYFLTSLHAADMSPSVRYIRQITCRRRFISRCGCCVPTPTQPTIPLELVGWGVNGQTSRSTDSVSCSIGWCPTEGYRNKDQLRPIGTPRLGGFTFLSQKITWGNLVRG